MTYIGHRRQSRRRCGGGRTSPPSPKKWFKEDIVYQVEDGFFLIVNWDNIKHDLPGQLKMSPAAVVPQTNRRDRIILDLSFPVRVAA